MSDARINNLVKLGIRDEDGEVETPWATALGENKYRIENIPFFAYDISAEDIVEALPEADGMLMLTRVIEKSGNRTIRANLGEASPADLRERFLTEIKKLGCDCEGAFSWLICINVPPAASLNSVAKLLNQYEFEWEYADPSDSAADAVKD